MICNPCNFESTKIIFKDDLEDDMVVIRENTNEQNQKKENAKVEVLRTCVDCVAENMYNRKDLSLETAQKFCKCFAAGHDGDKIARVKPLQQNLLDDIESLKEADTADKKAKNYYEEKKAKEIQDQLDYADAHPRDEENNV